MKGKVYRRNINPSIHQPRAAAKDLISSGASKHGVPDDKLHRDRERANARVQGAPSKNSHSSPSAFPSRAVAASEILSPVCCQIYLCIENARPQRRYVYSAARLEENKTKIRPLKRCAVRRVFPDTIAATAADASLSSHAQFFSRSLSASVLRRVFKEIVLYFLRLLGSLRIARRINVRASRRWL